MRLKTGPLWLLCLILLSACSPTKPTLIPTIALPPSPTAAPPTPLPSATPAPTQTALPQGSFENPVVVPFVKDLTMPDDLLLAADGSLYVSDVGDGSIRQILPDGQVNVLLTGLSSPEGMVILPDGSLVFAEQGRNRLARWDPQTKQAKTLLELENTTGSLGVDGITLDTGSANGPTLIIPDSPNHRLLRASLDGKILDDFAHGISRPVDAWVKPDGTLLVVDENGGGGALDLVNTNGRVDRIAGLSTPDDVVMDSAGNIFIAAIGDNSIHWIPANTQTEQVLVKDIAGPQGLAIDPAGNLLVSEPARHRIIKILLH